MRTYVNRLAHTALCAAIALGIGGCAANRDGQEPLPASLEVPPPAVSHIPAIADGQIPELPLDPYFLDPQEHQTLLRSLRLLTGECMAKAGIPMPPAPSGPAPADTGRNDRRYGLIDSAGATSRGYHPPTQSSQADPPLSQEQLDALAGTPDGKPGPGGSPAIGCNSAAAMQITGTRDYPANDQVVREINVASFELSRKDDRVVAAIRSWSACMARSGHSQPDPLNIDGISETGISDAEKEIARADIGCKRETGLVAVWNAVETAYQHELIQKNKKALDEVLGKRAEQLKKADGVLARQ